MNNLFQWVSSYLYSDADASDGLELLLFFIIDQLLVSESFF
jgi:hypothetical protein